MPQPRILHVAVDEEVGAHRGADRKQRQIGHPVRRSLGIIGERTEIEARPVERFEIKSDADRMAGTHDLASDTEILPQADVQSVRQHDQTRGNLLAAR